MQASRTGVKVHRQDRVDRGLGQVRGSNTEAGTEERHKT